MSSRHTAQNRLSLDCVSGQRARHPIQKGLPYPFYFFRTQTVAHHQQVEYIVARNARLLAPVIVEKDALDRGRRSTPANARNASSDAALTVRIAAPQNSGSSRTRSVTLLTAPNVPPPPPFSAQNKSEFVHAFATLTFPSELTTSASNNPTTEEPPNL